MVVGYSACGEWVVSGELVVGYLAGDEWLWVTSGSWVMSGLLVAQRFNYHVNDISVYLGRQRGGGGDPIERTHFTQASFFKPGVVCFLLCKHLKLHRLEQKLQGKASSSFF